MPAGLLAGLHDSGHEQLEPVFHSRSMPVLLVNVEAQQVPAERSDLCPPHFEMTLQFVSSGIALTAYSKLRETFNKRFALNRASARCIFKIQNCSERFFDCANRSTRFRPFRARPTLAGYSA